jgi:UDP-N-acetylglucosamine 3-dehydrogenase
MKIHNIAIIGMGMISKSHATAIRNLPNARCAAVADTVFDKAAAAGRELHCPFFTDAREMLQKVPEIDIVIIALPTFLHASYSVLCLEAGKAVLCEKPLEMSLQHALEVKEAVERTGGIFMTAQVVRFWPGYSRIKRLYEDGELGEIRMSFFSRCSQIQRWDNDWLFDPVTGGGALHDMMVHDLDFMNYLFGDAKTVYAIASKDGTGCYNDVFASICYQNGAKGVAQTSFSMKSGYPFTMHAELMGTKATVEYTYKAGFDVNQRNEAESCLRLYRDGMDPVIEHPWEYDPYTKQLAYFISCAEERRQPAIVTPAQSVEVIRTVDAVERSADSGLVVDMDSAGFPPRPRR